MLYDVFLFKSRKKHSSKVSSYLETERLQRIYTWAKVVFFVCLFFCLHFLIIFLNTMFPEASSKLALTRRHSAVTSVLCLKENTCGTKIPLTDVFFLKGIKLIQCVNAMTRGRWQAFVHQSSSSAAVCCWESCPEIYLNQSGTADIRKDRNILPSAVSDGGTASDSLTHTSVGSRASALRAEYTHKYTQANTQVQDRSCAFVTQVPNLTTWLQTGKGHVWTRQNEISAQNCWICCDLSHGAS